MFQLEKHISTFFSKILSPSTVGIYEVSTGNPVNDPVVIIFSIADCIVDAVTVAAPTFKITLYSAITLPRLNRVTETSSTSALFLLISRKTLVFTVAAKVVNADELRSFKSLVNVWLILISA